MSSRRRAGCAGGPGASEVHGRRGKGEDVIGYCTSVDAGMVKEFAGERGDCFDFIDWLHGCAWLEKGGYSGAPTNLYLTFPTIP